MARLAAFDMDGTLLLPTHTLGEATLATLRALLNKQITITFATGRHYLDMQPQIAPLALDAWLITGNGTRIHDSQGRVHYAADLAPDVVEEVIHSCWMTEATLHAFNDAGWYTAEDRPALLDAHRASGFCYQLRDLRTLPAHQVTKLCFIGEHTQLCQLQSRLRAALGERAHLCFSAWECLEVLPLACNKGEALSWLVSSLGLTLNDCMAFGDAMNDQEMLARVGKGYVMGNAMHQLKAALPHLPVIGTSATQSVSHFLNHWLNTPHLTYSPEY
ncbi:thiamine pyrimidine pyrophosphate hydrolase [Erwinia sp. OLTSP20]|uniref:HMP-PP phosphatase n=1 Tax=unclassified Erwinia TaxID=2622719 RepID=UPI000C181EDF|nr:MULTISPECIES: HMP-PP phosphatase [unclassified Erwinia]PIJ52219.1 thiamine pyrimidine pyrophosphate hydrolase [Erwinia sp. OAMSP11]PIJ75738.1 thiamine pyrimidine pyrophosphate hydrolase [Erwinia sp. OLSSP12]PIJ81145.1 thiamine pyrimidine pyrophosphate hydrolase [Erwinia sp. OLMTSP26]PIJ84226.1 thiamine pyrimidine pyrophosphate hydrolase [Erwinia sp. OLCASP19]PIJ88691.1 thiamine pyrimidine pyrophosphate hydrolase [Erwinia sp. OLMDSP33]